MSSTIQPETILRELAELWISLGKDTQPGPTSGVLRACTMTLVAMAEESEDPSNVWAVMAALMPEHPSRAIVIRFRQSAERELSSRVFSQCWMPFGQRRQICCEQIEITASDASLPDLPAVIVPLAVSDLPVILWCRGSRLARLPDFPLLARVAHKLIVDSAVFDDPAGILNWLERSSSSGQVLGDLAWTRLTRWRELVAQIFENRSYLARLSAIDEIRIGYGGTAVPVSAYYLAAWLLDSLEKAGAKARIQMESIPDAPGGTLARLELAGTQSDAMKLVINVSGDAERQCADLEVDALSNRTVFPADNDYSLLREELSITGRDPVYAKTLEWAARLANGGNL